MKRYRIILLLFHVWIIVALCVLTRDNRGKNSAKKSGAKQTNPTKGNGGDNGMSVESSGGWSDSSDSNEDSDEESDLSYDSENSSSYSEDNDDDIETMNKEKLDKMEAKYKKGKHDKKDKKDASKKMEITNDQKKWMNTAKNIMESVVTLTNELNAILEHLDPKYKPNQSKELSIILIY